MLGGNLVCDRDTLLSGPVMLRPIGEDARPTHGGDFGVSGAKKTGVDTATGELIRLWYSIAVPVSGPFMQATATGRLLCAVVAKRRLQTDTARIEGPFESRLQSVLLSGTLTPVPGKWIEVCPGIEVRGGEIRLESNTISVTPGTEVARCL
jgi:hypothetical protein